MGRKLNSPIRLSEETREQLKSLCKKGQSYNDMINQLIQFWKEMKGVPNDPTT